MGSSKRPSIMSSMQLFVAFFTVITVERLVLHAADEIKHEHRDYSPPDPENRPDIQNAEHQHNNKYSDRERLNNEAIQNPVYLHQDSLYMEKHYINGNVYVDSLTKTWNYKFPKEVDFQIIGRKQDSLGKISRLTKSNTPLFDKESLSEMGPLAQHHICSVSCEKDIQHHVYIDTLTMKESVCISHINGITCGLCRCDDLCGLYGDCCLDERGRTKPPPEDAPQFIFTCRQVKTRHFRNYFVVDANRTLLSRKLAEKNHKTDATYRVINNGFVQSKSFPKQNSDNKDYLQFVTEMCRQCKDTRLHVFNPTTSYIFCNYACASLFGALNIRSMEKIHQRCRSESTSNLSSSTVAAYLFKNGTDSVVVCDPEIVDTEDNHARACSDGYLNLIDYCPETILPDAAVSSLEKERLRQMCQAYRYPVRAKSKEGFIQNYNNIFCAVCHEADMKQCTEIYSDEPRSDPGESDISYDELSHHRGESNISDVFVVDVIDGELSNISITRFVEMWSLANLYIGKEDTFSCEEGWWYDTYKGVCRLVHCFEGKVSKDGSRCVLSEDPPAIGKRYAVTLAVRPSNLDLDQSHIPQNYSSEWTEGILSFFNSINPELSEISNHYRFSIGHLTPYSRNYTIPSVSNITDEGYNNVTETQFFTDFLDSVPHAVVQLNVEITENVTKRFVHKKIHELFNTRSPFALTRNESVDMLMDIWVIYMLSSDMTYFAFFKKTPNDHFCCQQYATRIVSKLSEISTGTTSAEYSVSDLNQGERFFNQIVCSFVHLNSWEIKIENSEEMRLLGQEKPINSNLYTVIPEIGIVAICVNDLEKYYVSPYTEIYWTWGFHIVFIIVSFISLICLIITIIVFVSVLKLRSIPTKNNLGLAVTLCFIHIAPILLSEIPAKTPLCVIFGLFYHYLWLCYVFWMSVSSYHMFSTFVLNKTSIEPASNKRRFRIYLAYTLLLPVVFVVVTIVTSEVTFGNIGYGNFYCSVDNVWLMVFFMTGPLFGTIFFNVIFFFATIWTIHRTPRVDRRSGAETRNVYVYLKLSTITGMSWLFLLTAYLHRWLYYASNLLVASQGILFFLSFGCNKKWCLEGTSPFKKARKYLSFNKRTTSTTTESNV